MTLHQIAQWIERIFLNVSPINIFKILSLHIDFRMGFFQIYTDQIAKCSKKFRQTSSSFDEEVSSIDPPG